MRSSTSDRHRIDIAACDKIDRVQPGSKIDVTVTYAWQPVAVPGDSGIGSSHDGVTWYRCLVKLPKGWSGKSITLAVEQLDDSYEAFLNGAKIGGAGKFPPNFQSGSDAPGRYSLPVDRLRFDEWNLVALRVYQHEGRGGFQGAAPMIGTDKQHIDTGN